MSFINQFSCGGIFSSQPFRYGWPKSRFCFIANSPKSLWIFLLACAPIQLNKLYSIVPSKNVYHDPIEALRCSFQRILAPFFNLLTLSDCCQTWCINGPRCVLCESQITPRMVAPGGLPCGIKVFTRDPNGPLDLRRIVWFSSH